MKLDIKVLHGITNLCASSKGTLTLLVLAISSVGLLNGVLGGAPFAAIVSSVVSLYHWTSHAETIASLNVPKGPST